MDKTGSVIAMEGIVVDIDHMKALESSLRSLSAAVEQSPVSVVITDLAGCIQYVNPKFEEVTGYRAEEAIGKPPSILKSGTTAVSVYEELWRTLLAGGTWRGEFVNRRKDGEIFCEEAHITPVLDTEGAVYAYAAVKLDITARKEMEERLRRTASHDTLTGLPNRALFSERLQQALALADRERHRVALIFLDLDRFKEVNDTLGHAVGDLVLVEAARRMCATVRTSDSVGRIGGDEFVVLLPVVREISAALAVAEKLRDALEVPFAVEGHGIEISGSFGISLYPDHGANEVELSRHADAAMYQAKQAGRNAVRLFA